MFILVSKSNANRFHSSKKISTNYLNDSKNVSLQFIKAKTQNNIDKTNIKNEDLSGTKNKYNISGGVSSTLLNKLEINIKQKINNMKVEFEKNNKKLLPLKIMSISPNKLRQIPLKLTSLKKGIKKRKHNSKKSVLNLYL